MTYLRTVIQLRIRGVGTPLSLRGISAGGILIVSGACIGSISQRHQFSPNKDTGLARGADSSGSLTPVVSPTMTRSFS